MAFSNVSAITTLFMLTIFLLISKQNIVTSSKITSYPLIQRACSGRDIDSNLCIQILGLQRRVVSAKTLFELSIGIMESGISNATNTRRYVQKRLNSPGIDPRLKDALKGCKLSYDSVIASLNSALGEVRDIKEYQVATYDLMIASTDNIKPCIDAMSSNKIKDGTILIGNKVVPIFGLSASHVVEPLES